MNDPRIGSLFTGTGALDMAAQAVFGGRTVWYSDIKPAAEALLAQRLPGVPNFGNLVSAFPVVGPVTAAAAALEPIDILTGGWPCQPHSSAGKRLGEADPRALWPNVARVIAELRPRVFLGENVARIATNGELRRVVRSLDALGYVGTWRCVTAESVGAPHKRDRCFVVAVRADALGDLPADSGDDSVIVDRTVLLPTPAQRDGRRGSGWGHLPGRPLSETIQRLAPPATGWGEYGPAIERWKRVLGRSAPPPTVRGARNDVAQLSATFVEWMMGLPEGWVTDVEVAPKGSLRNAHLSLLGDGLVRQQAEAAYRACLVELLGLGSVAA